MQTGEICREEKTAAPFPKLRSGMLLYRQPPILFHLFKPVQEKGKAHESDSRADRIGDRGCLTVVRGKDLFRQPTVQQKTDQQYECCTKGNHEAFHLSGRIYHISTAFSMRKTGGSMPKNTDFSLAFGQAGEKTARPEKKYDLFVQIYRKHLQNTEESAILYSRHRTRK